MENIKESSQDFSNWNVLTEQWLQGMSLNGEAKFYSPIQALKKACSIHSITFSSPLDFFSTHRFLLTLLYWKADVVGGIKKLSDSLLRKEIPKELIEEIQKETNHFNLFDKDNPFLQDLSVKKKDLKSVGALFAEMASGTNIAHFHHGNDKEMEFCLKCTTLGMLRVVPWTQSGGSGLTPSVHGAPPIMAIAIDRNLAETLKLNLVPLKEAPGTMKWSGLFKPVDKETQIPYLVAFSWNPRRVLLPPPESIKVCWNCGQKKVAGVGQIYFQKNEHTTSRKKGGKNIPFEWEDPAAFYKDDSPFVTVKSSKETIAAKGLDLKFLNKKEGFHSTVLQKNGSHKGWNIIVPCTNPANIKTFDHRKIEISDFSDIPPSEQKEPPKKGMDGWKELPENSIKGATTFVKTAVRLFTPADWSVLAAAKHRKMSAAPAAFDLFTGLYWSLRDNKRVSHVPQKNVCWLVLKLMATVPAIARIQYPGASYCPFQSLPKRQLNAKDGKQSPYPRALPQGNRLETKLRKALDHHLRQRSPKHIDWVALCSSIHQQFN